MDKLFEKLRDRLDLCNPRERIVILLAGVVVIAMAWYVGFAESTLNQQKQQRSHIAGIETQIANAKTSMLQQRRDGGVANTRLRLDELQNKAAAVDNQLQQFTSELISPVDMARLLEQVLARRSSLRLLRLKNKGAEDLLPPDSPGQHRLYRHGLELELEGPYLAVLAYLEDLEQLPWRLYWQHLEIDIDEYPVNRIRIEVATLSLHEDWIGV